MELMTRSKSPCCSAKKLFSLITRKLNPEIKEALPPDHNAESLNALRVQRLSVVLLSASVCRLHGAPRHKHAHVVLGLKVKLEIERRLLAAIG